MNSQLYKNIIMYEINPLNGTCECYYNYTKYYISEVIDTKYD